jgi:Ca-activated chloride channel family protein
MTHPTISLTPLQAARPSGRDTVTDVLIRITPAIPADTSPRPPLNLGLVIDRSGSMEGDRLRYAKQAVNYLVAHLQPTDRVSVIAFDDRVDVLVPSTLVTDRPAIQAAVERLECRGSTNLHAGWREGAKEVSLFNTAGHVNRVILLSDGQANAGETNLDKLASEAHALAGQGISTTTIGIGNGYNEDLLIAMARSGDGNPLELEHPSGLRVLFADELAGLTATVGRQVSLGLEPGPGVRVLDVLNDFETLPTGRYRLPNLIGGEVRSAVVRLTLAADAAEHPALTVRLAWDDIRSKRRTSQRASFDLPAVSAGAMADFPPHDAVRHEVSILTLARARQEAVRLLDAGDVDGSRHVLSMASLALAEVPEMTDERHLLMDLAERMAQGDVVRARKNAVYESQQSRFGKRGRDQG